MEGVLCIFDRLEGLTSQVLSNKLTLEQLMETRTEINKLNSDLKRLDKVSIDLYHSIDRKILKTCKHIWIINYTQSLYVCSICKSKVVDPR